MNYKYYTVGFYFTEDLQYVALVRKCKPEWQNGLLNGVGGKQENGESIVDCMEREFEEESGIRWRGWTHFLTGDITCHQGPCIVYYMAVIGPRFTPKKDDKEQVNFYLIHTLKTQDPVPNLSWLIPMALLKLKNKEWEEPAKWETV